MSKVYLILIVLLLISQPGCAAAVKKMPMQKAENMAYCWTPDGKVAFYRRIDHWIKMEPDPFPGGGGVYDDYEKNDEAYIVIRDPETKVEKVLFKIPYKGSAGYANYMDWSIKNNKILLSTGVLEILSPDGKEYKEVSKEDRICGLGTWSPDGEKILYSAGPIPGQEEKGPKPGLYLMNADGSDNHLLVENGMSGSWSPDGEQIVYQTAGRRATKEDVKKLGFTYLEGTPDQDIYVWIHDIYIINPDNTDKKLLLERAANPIWSPDGKWILCGGKLITPDGKDIIKIKVPGSFSRWSPDMRHLLSLEGIIGKFEIPQR